MSFWRAAWFVFMLLFYLSGDPLSASEGGAVDSQAPYPRTISLNGPWDRQFLSSDLPGAVTSDGWSRVQVPSREANATTHFAAYRKIFSLPPKSAEEHVSIRFGGVAFASRVYLNGSLVGVHGPTLEPHCFDLTPYVRELNELVVFVQDWTAGIEGSQIPGAGGRTTEQGMLYEFSAGNPFDENLWHKMVAPMGIDYRLFGIWDDVSIEVYQGIVVDDIAIESLVEEGKVRVSGRIRNMMDREWSGRLTLSVMEDHGQEAFRIDPVASGQSRAFSFMVDAKGLACWEVGKPVLYHLRIDFEDLASGGMGRYGKIIPFGYRQFKVRNHELWLNGKKIHLFTASVIDTNLTPERLADHIRKLRNLHVNTVRFHGNIFPGWYYDLMDKMGMLVVAESALYGSFVVQYKYDSDTFFENAAAHWRGLVQKLRNHPSVVVYSIENECIQYSHGDRAEKKFAELGRMVRQWDPTRPILYNGGDDPEGAADIVSLHYPHELPFWNQYPKDAWWLRDAINEGKSDRDCHKDCGATTAGGKKQTYIDFFWYHKPDFRWSWNRNKPLDIGEIGHFWGGEPHRDAILFGDAAFSADRSIRDATQAEVWRHTVEAARALDVAMINPWNPPSGEKANEALKDALKPVKWIFYPENPERSYGGSTLRWKGVLLNDTRETRRFLLRYTLAGAKSNRVRTENVAGPLLLAPGGHRELEIRIPLPKVKRVTAYSLKVSVHDTTSGNESEKGARFESDKMAGAAANQSQNSPMRYSAILDEVVRPVSVYPLAAALAWKSLKAVYLYDPSGDTVVAFRRLGIPCRVIGTIQSMPGRSGILVIGRDALAGLDNTQLGALTERISAGRHSTLVLEQEHYPVGFPRGLTVNERHGTTLGFTAAPGHPLIDAIDAYTSGGEVFRRWQPSQNISHKDFNLPLGGFRPLIVGGGTGGLIYAPIVEKPGTEGATLFSQLALTGVLQDEPAAVVTLYHALQYLQDPSKRVRSSLVHESARVRLPKVRGWKNLHLPDALAIRLSEWGLQTHNTSITDDYQGIFMVDAPDLASTPHLAVPLVKWVEAGNILWLTGIEDQSQPLLNQFAGGLKIVPFRKDRLPVRIISRDSSHKAVLCASSPCPSGSALDAAVLMQGILNQYLYWSVPTPVAGHDFSKLLPPSRWMFEPPVSLPGPGAAKERIYADKGSVSARPLPSAPHVVFLLTEPALIAAIQIGRGIVILDTISWAEMLKPRAEALNVTLHLPSSPVSVVAADENQERVLRLLTSLLVNMGARIDVQPFVQIEAEDMQEKTPGQPVMRNWMHHYWEIFSNNYIATTIPLHMDSSTNEANDVGTIEIKARSLIYTKEPPRMQVVLNGAVVGEAEVREPFWHIYRFKVEKQKGEASGRDHRIEIRLINNVKDAYNQRQLILDWVRLWE